MAVDAEHQPRAPLKLTADVTGQCNPRCNRIKCSNRLHTHQRQNNLLTSNVGVCCLRPAAGSSLARRGKLHVRAPTTGKAKNGGSGRGSRARVRGGGGAPSNGGGRPKLRRGSAAASWCGGWIIVFVDCRRAREDFRRSAVVSGLFPLALARGWLVSTLVSGRFLNGFSSKLLREDYIFFKTKWHIRKRKIIKWLRTKLNFHPFITTKTLE